MKMVLFVMIFKNYNEIVIVNFTFLFVSSSIVLTLLIFQMCTVEDHHKDIVRFCQRNSFHGIIADDPEYLVFDIQRYFSAQKLKLTFKVLNFNLGLDFELTLLN